MDKLSIWDGDFIPFYVCHVKKDEPEKSLEDCLALCDNIIFNINNAINASHMIMCLSKNKSFRNIIYPDYKANRKYADTPKWFFEVRQYLFDKYQGIVYEGKYEADDLVCIYRNMYKNEYEGIIVSPDKDILKLEGKKYNPRKNEFVITNSKEADYHFWVSMITGDTIDNLPGIKGIGIKGAEKLFNSNSDIFIDYKSLVFNKYCEIYGEDLGIDLFYKMYKCLKMVQYDDSIEKPKLITLTNEMCGENRIFN